MQSTYIPNLITNLSFLEDVYAIFLNLAYILTLQNWIRVYAFIVQCHVLPAWYGLEVILGLY
jgi:hypothetical protein